MSGGKIEEILPRCHISRVEGAQDMNNFAFSPVVAQCYINVNVKLHHLMLYQRTQKINRRLYLITYVVNVTVVFGIRIVQIIFVNFYWYSYL